MISLRQLGLLMLLLGAVVGLARWTDTSASALGRELASQPAAQTPGPLDPDAPAPDQVGPANNPATQRPVSIARGLAIANDTPRYAPEYIGGTLSCTDCHVDAGRQGNAWPWLGVSKRYPEFDPRTGRQLTLAERIQQCFLRSENGTAPQNGDPVLESLVAYIDSLSAVTTSYPPGTHYEDMIPAANRLPRSQLLPASGEILYGQQCAMCHGTDGAGVGDAPPLWGADSYNQGAGAGRIYVLAGFIRANMPQDAPGTLTDTEAQQLAAYIDGQPRPAFAGLAQDYPDGQIPPDAVYYRRRDDPASTR